MNLEKRNIKITLQYDGTRYDGWQKQGNTDKTIQGKLEQVLEKMAGIPVSVHGAGRTDAGVHALRQTANVHLPVSLALDSDSENTDRSNGWKPQEIKEYLNRYLPEDIAVLKAAEAGPRFHSRLNAVSKTYVYRIETAAKKDVFTRKYVYGLGKHLDLQVMQEAAEYLTGTHDFVGFSSLKKVKKSTVRNLSSIEVSREGSLVELKFHGNGFLYNMIRIIAGTLIEVGLQQRTAASVGTALESRDRSQAGFTAPPEGLFLMEVDYESS